MSKISLESYEKKTNKKAVKMKLCFFQGMQKWTYLNWYVILDYRVRNVLCSKLSLAKVILETR